MQNIVKVCNMSQMYAQTITIGLKQLIKLQEVPAWTLRMNVCSKMH